MIKSRAGWAKEARVKSSSFVIIGIKFVTNNIFQVYWHLTIVVNQSAKHQCSRLLLHVYLWNMIWWRMLKFIWFQTIGQHFFRKQVQHYFVVRVTIEARYMCRSLGFNVSTCSAVPFVFRENCICATSFWNFWSVPIVIYQNKKRKKNTNFFHFLLVFLQLLT